jgi:hypothetical protein
MLVVELSVRAGHDYRIEPGKYRRVGIRVRVCVPVDEEANRIEVLCGMTESGGPIHSGAKT